jgi:hypothetical protein
MPISRNRPKPEHFNPAATLPFELRLDFSIALQDIYDFFFDVNSFLTNKGLRRLDNMLRPAIMSGLLSDLLTESLAKHSRVLTQNCHFNGHPDLLVKGVYPNDGAKAGTEGVEIKPRESPAARSIRMAPASNGWRYLSMPSMITRSQRATAHRCVSPRSISATSRLMIFAKTHVANWARGQPLCIEKVS